MELSSSDRAALTPVPELLCAPSDLDLRLRGLDTPCVIRGVAKDWPMVREAHKGADAVRAYLLEHCRDRSFPANIGLYGGDRRLFYNHDMAMNFREIQAPLETLFAEIAKAEANPESPVIYLSSIDMDHFFKGLADANRLPLGSRRPLESIWIGTQTIIAAHNDVPDNLAICAAGRRRFTLFPPDQFHNLYLGPLENTPAGRPVSMVDLHAPDFDRYPRFQAALSTALVADLAPGDAIFVPSLWWHHVEGLAPFNILVNYWWRDVPHFLGKPEDALLHAILALRDLPAPDKERWRALFEHYVFSDGTDAADHLPMADRGILAPLNPESAGQLRARLLRSLAR
jgi:hypothetical protein